MELTLVQFEETLRAISPLVCTLLEGWEGSRSRVEVLRASIHCIKQDTSGLEPPGVNLPRYRKADPRRVLEAAQALYC